MYLVYCFTIALLVLSPCSSVFGGSHSEGGGSADAVIFAVETSGALTKADPQGLIFHALKLYAGLAGKDDSIGIIAFNKKGTSVIKKKTPAGPAIYTAIDSIAKPSSDNNTASNPYTALKDALTELTPDNTSRRTVVLISASGAYAQAAEEDQKIRAAILDELIPLYKDKEVRLFTVSLGTEPDEDFLLELSKNTGGFNYPCPNAASLNTTFASIYETIKSPDILPMQTGRFIVDESIDSLTLLLFKSAQNTKIILQGPDGVKYSAGKSPANISWGQSFNFDIVNVAAPLSGVWSITGSTASDNRIYISTHLKLLSSVQSSYMQVNTKKKVDAWLELDGHTIDMRELTNTLGVRAAITGPDGVTVNVKLDFTEDTHGSSTEGGIFGDYFTPKAMGLYKFSLSAKSKTIERKKSFVVGVVEKQDTGIEQPHLDGQEPIEEVAVKKPSKILLWLKKMVTHDPSALDKALVRFLPINLVLFSSVLLYINRAKIMARGKRMAANVKLPKMNIFTKYLRRPERPQETDDQD